MWIWLMLSCRTSTTTQEDCPVYDADGDGFSLEDGDCNDLNPAIYPNAEDICDGMDNDCDGITDPQGLEFSYYVDGDGDGYGAEVFACAPPEDVVDEGGDCDDTDETIFPGAIEICGDVVDQDCDGLIDSDDFCQLSTSAADAHFLSDLASPMGAGGALGDITGDGELDMVAHSFLPSENSSSEGAIHIFSGPFAEQQLTTESQYQLQLSPLDEGSVYNVMTDFNGDGQSDLIVASVANSFGGEQAGAVYLILGPIDTSLSLEDDYSLMWTGMEGDWVGHSVADLGDVNGDGRSDLLIGSHEYNTSAAEGGAAYIIFGEEELVETSIYSISNADIILLGGEDDNLGYEVSSAGDVNGDGVLDLAINAYRYDTVNRNAGRTYVFFGPVDSSLSLAQADVRIDGYEEVSQQGSTLAVLPDTDGDGRDDLLVSSQYGEAIDSTDLTNDSGAAYIVTNIQSGDLLLSDVNSKIFGVQTGENFGREAKGLGDINEDGFGDVIISSKRFGDEYTEQGRMSIFYGPIEGAQDSDQGNILIYGADTGAWAGITLDVYGQGQTSELLIGARYLVDDAVYGEAHLFSLGGL